MPRIAFVLAALLSAPGAPAPHADVQRVSEQERLAEALRRESAAVVELADAALSGRPVPADLALVWRNDFFKAQPGTFVPFTLSFTAPALSARAALLYVRVERRDQAAAPGRPSVPARPVRLRSDLSGQDRGARRRRGQLHARVRRPERRLPGDPGPPGVT